MSVTVMVARISDEDEVRGEKVFRSADGTKVYATQTRGTSVITVIEIPAEIVKAIETIEVCEVCGCEGYDHDPVWHEQDAGWVMDA